MIAIPSVAAATTPRSTTALDPTPIATIDSPSAMITIKPWRSAKCPGMSCQPSEPKRSGPPMSSRARRPRARSAPNRRCRCSCDQADADRRASDEATYDRRAERVVTPARDHEEPEVRQPHDPVGAGEGERVVAEGVRDAEGGDEERGHRGEERSADCSFLGVDDAREPRVAHPGPPEDPQHQRPAYQPAPGRVGRHQGRALRDGEDEHEVEEQLERRDPLLLASRCRQPMRAGGSLHAR